MCQAPVVPRPPVVCKITGYDQLLPGLLRQLSAAPASGPDDRLHGEAGRLRCSRMQEMQESWPCQPAPCFSSSTIMSEAFSAIMIAGALVFTEVRVGMHDVTTIRTPPTPYHLSLFSHTAKRLCPLFQLPHRV